MSQNEIIQRLARAFAANGKELYLVGGTVRDALLGRDAHDIDCCTDALPDEIKRIVATTGALHIVPIGEKFGTIQVQYIGYPEPLVIEITTYRGERYTVGLRKPDVQFGNSIYEDLRRRDFTINAIAKNPLTGHYIDVWYGRRDLKDKLIRAVDDATQRFRDDPLRLLRAVRLAAQFNFKIAEVTAMAMREEAEWIKVISRERIRDEFCKILLLNDPVYGLHLLTKLDLMWSILPEVAAMQGVEQPPHHSMDVWHHTATVVRMVPARLEVRLAALLHDIAKPVTKTMDGDVAHFYEHEDVGAEMARSILQRLRFGNEITEHVSKVVKLHMRVNQYTSKWSNGSVRRLFLDAGDCIDDLLDLAIADGASDRDEPREQVEARINELRERIQQVQVQAVDHPIRSPLDGNELMQLFGRGPGAWLKEVKQYLNDQVIEGKLQSGDREGAVALLRSWREGDEEDQRETLKVLQEAGIVPKSAEEEQKA
jgi:poly(A) polymerase